MKCERILKVRNSRSASAYLQSTYDRCMHLQKDRKRMLIFYIIDQQRNNFRKFKKNLKIKLNSFFL